MGETRQNEHRIDSGKGYPRREGDTVPCPTHTNRLWVVADKWDTSVPWKGVVEYDVGGITNRASRKRGYGVGQVPRMRTEERHPIYRIEENGIDIGWKVFWWIDLDTPPSDLWW